MSPQSSIWTTTNIMSPLSSLCVSSPTITIEQLSIKSDIDQGSKIRGEYRIRQRLAIAGNLWEIRRKKWKRVLWRSACMSLNSVDLCIKYTQWMQYRPKHLVLGPCIWLRPSLLPTTTKGHTAENYKELINIFEHKVYSFYIHLW